MTHQKYLYTKIFLAGPEINSKYKLTTIQKQYAYELLGIAHDKWTNGLIKGLKYPELLPQIKNLIDSGTVLQLKPEDFKHIKYYQHFIKSYNEYNELQLLSTESRVNEYSS